MSEFRKTTGTSKLIDARRRARALIAAQEAKWEQLRKQFEEGVEEKCEETVVPQTLTPDLISHICGRRLYHWLRLDDVARFEGAGYDEATGAALTQLCEVTDRSMRSVVQRGRASAEWADVLDVIDIWCDQVGSPVERTDPLYPELVKAFAAVEREAADRLLRRNNGEPVATPVEPNKPKAPEAPKGSVTLSAVIEPYREFKQKKASKKHLGTSVNIWKRLIDHLGDVPLSSVKGSDIYSFLDARMHSPKRPWSMEYAHGLVTRTLEEVFRFARTLGHLDGDNPVDRMEVKPPLDAKEELSRKKPRLPFSDAQLTTLFTSEWYRTDSERWRGKMRKDLAARYWVPLVCLMHGNRVREVLQLVASDIRSEGEVPVVNFRAELEGEQADLQASGAVRSVKNEATSRVVPLHPMLCQLGFVEFVKQRRQADGEHALLFPSSLPEPGGRTPILGRAYEQAFLRYVRDELGYGRGFGNHSFRHQLEDRIREAQRPGHQWPAGMAQAYTGRKRVRAQDVGRIETEGSEAAYGRGHSPAVLLEYLKTLSFDGVTLPPAFEAWMTGTTHRA